MIPTYISLPHKKSSLFLGSLILDISNSLQKGL